MSINRIANNIFLPPTALSRKENFYIAKRFFKKQMKIKKANKNGG